MSCKISIIKLIAIAAVMLSGCTNDSDVLPEGEGGTMTFQLSTRAGNGIGEGQQVRLFVAERAQEHSGFPGEVHPEPDQYGEIPDYKQPEEDLHVVETIDLGGSSYQVTGLYGQWYKFAFVCTPKVGGELFGPETENHDFGECYIDYEPVLDYQSNLNDVEDEDLAIYRKVIDRWAIANTILEEDVLLERITGQLVLVMGKPKDQFPKEVESIHVKLTNIPTQFYIHDNANGDILIKETGSSATRTIDAKWEFEPGEFDANEEIVITLNLLPYTFVNNAETGSGRIEDRISIIYTQGAASDSYPLQNDEGEPIQIKPNTRTIVRFNGMHPEEFEVRYAGFADGNDAVVGVDDDEWTGSKLD